MMSSRRPPTRMPTRPISHPLMTWFAPIVNWNGWPVHDDWITLPEEWLASTYWTVTVSPGPAAAPLPTMRSALSSCLGGVPEGTVTVGAVFTVPAGERRARGMAAMAVLFGPGVAVVAVVGVAGGAVVVGAAVVVVAAVGVPDGLLQAASPKADADSTTKSGRIGRRDMEADPFGRRAIPR